MNPFLPWPRLLTFDLDGTLLDSLEGIADSANHVRKARGYSAIANDQVRAAIGDGAQVLVERTMGDILESGLSLDTLYEQFREVYMEESLREPRFYPGAREFLDQTLPHHTLAVLTNKPLAISERMLDALGVTSHFVRILAPENSRAKKPDPGGMVGLLEDLDITPEEALLFGDSIKDFAAGKGAGVRTIGMREGYHTPGIPDPDFWADDFQQLRQLWQQAFEKSHSA